MQQFTSRESDVAAQPDIVSWQPLTPHSLAVADPTGIPATERDSIEDRGIQDPQTDEAPVVSSRMRP